MTSDSKVFIFGESTKNLDILWNNYDITNMSRCETASDSHLINRIIDSESTSTSNNNIYIISDDEIINDKSHIKNPDYTCDLNSESETELFLSTRRNATKRQKCKKPKRVSVKKRVTNKRVKEIQISDSNTDNSPLKGVRTKKKTAKRKNNSPLKDVQTKKKPAKRKTKPNNISDTSIRNNLSESIDFVHTMVSPDTRRTKRRRHQRSVQYNTTPNYPTYNIGNTETYFDKSEDIPLFKSKPKTLEEIIILDEEPDEEKVTVKVNWQNFEVFKFHLGQSENLRQIYDFFAKKENVSDNRLYFAYNDEVLTCDDSPHSIKYKIATFIEGGLISPDIINLVRDNFSSKPSGIQIKFQCQNVKRPYEIAVQPNDKLSLAMVKCAEHFKKPLLNLKFEFDGEQIIGTTTAKNLDLENGDCIDVRIIK